VEEEIDEGYAENIEEVHLLQEESNAMHLTQMIMNIPSTTGGKSPKVNLTKKHCPMFNTRCLLMHYRLRCIRNMT
jgi:hypothetical protein